MTNKELQKILKDHEKWLMDSNNGNRANLRSADLRSANLSSADLRYADLSSADLRSADLRYANLSSADLRSADLRYADLSSANLRSANLSYADLSSANLRSANLRYANLSSADLSSADLRSANLSSADLSSADLDYCFKRKITSNQHLMNMMFKRNKNGWIVYKSFNENYNSPKKWNVKKGKLIKNRIDVNRYIACSYGINVSTLNWCKRNCNNQLYKLLVPFTAEVCVPIQTDGKVRVSEAVVLNKIKSFSHDMLMNLSVESLEINDNLFERIK